MRTGSGIESLLAWYPGVFGDELNGGELTSFRMRNSVTNHQIGYYKEVISSYSHTLEQQEFIRGVFGRLDALIDLDFVEVGEKALIDIYRTYYNSGWGPQNGIPNEPSEIKGGGTAHFRWAGTDVSWRDYYPDDSFEASERATIVHEIGHALGLGDLGYDPRWSRKDSIMSYNYYSEEDWQVEWFRPADIAALQVMWGLEDDIQASIENSVINGRQFLGNGVDALYGQSNINIGMLDGNDVLEVVGGVNNFANGNKGDDLITLRGGLGRYLGGSQNDVLSVEAAEAGSWVNGNKDNDVITGNVDGVVYRGGSENDTLIVGAGTVWGDKGADTFRAVAGSGVAVVQDYTPGLDFVEGVSGGSFSSADGGISYGVGGDEMLLLLGISDSSQVSLI